MSERLPKEYAILREKYKKLEKENIKLKKIIKDWQAHDQMRISGYEIKEEAE